MEKKWDKITVNGKPFNPSKEDHTCDPEISLNFQKEVAKRGRRSTRNSLGYLHQNKEKKRGRIPGKEYPRRITYSRVFTPEEIQEYAQKNGLEVSSFTLRKGDEPLKKQKSSPGQLSPFQLFRMYQKRQPYPEGELARIYWRLRCKRQLKKK